MNSPIMNSSMEWLEVLTIIGLMCPVAAIIWTFVWREVKGKK